MDDNTTITQLRGMMKNGKVYRMSREYPFDIMELKTNSIELSVGDGPTVTVKVRGCDEFNISRLFSSKEEATAESIAARRTWLKSELDKLEATE